MEPTGSSLELAKELAKILPVSQIYNDLIAPGAKQIGYTIEDVVKAIRIATFPIQGIAALQDKFRAFLEASVDRIPETNRIPPAPRIVGPVLEGIRYEVDGSDISEMYSQLLSRSMDKDRKGEAHPSFLNIIRQLSSDEARILEQMHRKFIYLDFWESTEDGEASCIGFSLEDLALSFPENNKFYSDRLFTLGLMDYFRQSDKFQKKIGSRAAYSTRMRLSEVGQKFIKACGRQ